MTVLLQNSLAAEVDHVKGSGSRWQLLTNLVGTSAHSSIRRMVRGRLERILLHLACRREALSQHLHWAGTELLIFVLAGALSRSQLYSGEVCLMKKD